MDETREELKAVLSAAPEERESPWEEHWYLGNPFPAPGQVWPQVCYDQEAVKNAMKEAIKAFQDNSYQSRQLLIIGDHGSGKTNILKHYEYHLTQLRRDGIGEHIVPLYATGDVTSFVDLYSRVITTIGPGLLLGLGDAMKTQNKLDLLKDPDLGRAFTYLRADTSEGDRPERRETLFYKWIQAIPCHKSDCDRLGVSRSITTASQVIWVLADLVRSAREVSLFSGIILFLDEFEQAFIGGLPDRTQARYLQDLRNLIDIVQTGMLLVVVGTPIVLRRLEFYRALQRRLGSPHFLVDIENADEAFGYAQRYMDHARELFEDARDETLEDTPHILSPPDVRRIFDKVVASEPSLPRLGILIAKLHEAAEERARREQD